jgi:thiosulfate/3-mercaptopyruvate sulfurtransferase
MKKRIPTILFGVAFLLACGQEDARDTRDAVLDERPTRTTGDRSDAVVFVDHPAATAQLVFVGMDDTDRPDDRTDAVFVPLSTFMVERDGVPNMFPPADSMARLLEAAGVRGDRLVIIGAPIPAGRAYAGFDVLGLGGRAALLDGGPRALTPDSEPGSAAERTDPDARGRADARAALDIDVRDDIVVDAEWVHARLGQPRFAILDARPPVEFSGETPGADIERPGHIPGARNLFWATLVHSTDDTRLKDEAELRRMFEEAGVGPDDTIVAYCRTGGQAGFLYTVARHLGYDVRLYDGSFVDWSRTDYPVERQAPD